MKPSKAVIAGAAVAGLVTGSFAARTYAVSTSHNPGVSLQTVGDAEKALPKHACKGMNSCAGHGWLEMTQADCDAAKAKMQKDQPAKP